MTGPAPATALVVATHFLGKPTMHEKALERLRQLMLDLLKKLEVHKNGYLTVETIRHFWPLTRFLAKEYSTWVDPEPIYAFVSVSEALKAEGLMAAPGPLIHTADEARLGAVVDRLVSFWEGLPYTYEFLFPLPALEAKDDPVDIVKGVALKTCAKGDVGLAADLKEAQDISFANLLYLGGSQPQSPQQVRCLAIETQGLILLSSTSGITASTAVRKAKIVLELGLALGAFSIGWNERYRDVRSAGVKVLNGPPMDFSLFHLRASFAETLPQIRRPDVRENEAVAPLAECLAGVGIVLDHYEDASALKDPSKQKDGTEMRICFEQQCARIATAAEWLFDARTEGASPTTFVQTAIAFEALYGGNKNDPVVSTLGNRIAYALGDAPQERKSLMQQFEAFYDTRSAVVHKGASRLSSDEERQLWGAQIVLHRALVHELKLVSNGVKGLKKREDDRPKPPPGTEPA